MKRRSALEARLKRLEQRQLCQPLRRKVIFAVMDCDREVIAMSDNDKLHILRNAGEALLAFESRAAALIPSNFLFHVYRADPSGSCEAESAIDDAA